MSRRPFSSLAALDRLRLGRSAYAARRWGLVGVVLVAGVAVDRVFGPRRALPTPAFAALAFAVAIAAELLASRRCDADVARGARVRWAYAWDWVALGAAFAPALFPLLWYPSGEVPSNLVYLWGSIFGGLVAAGLARRRRAARAPDDGAGYSSSA